MIVPQTTTPKWFFRFVAFFTAIQVIWYAALLVDFVTHPWAPEYTYQSPFFRAIIALVISPSCVGVSLLVLRRTSGNVVGLFLLQWAILTMGQTMRTDSFLVNYSVVNLGWVSLWLLFLYFPNGRAFPYRFERAINRLSAALFLACYLWMFVVSTMPTWFMDGTVPNRFYIPALEPLGWLSSSLEGITLIAVMVLIPPSIVIRYFRSPFAIRQQMKWIVWVGILIIASSLVVGLLGINTKSTRLLTSVELFTTFVWGMFISLTPFIAVGIAILRHNLYDIDIIIRRTLIYSVLTAMLAALYFGGVVLVQATLRPIIGENSDAGIVISTLVIANLFAPLRRSIQNTIDRRFYLRKYDAEQTLAAFNATMRDEVDLDKLQAALLTVVQETMQPKVVMLWISELGYRELKKEAK